ncbi:MAG TPA: KamA family radical SAM protein [Chloroflexota bacterium]|nr:KamA family radical SAM protein [Chloroflexota bacterium]
MSLAEAIRTSVTTTHELHAYLAERGLAERAVGVAGLAEPGVLPVRVPRYYLDLIDWEDPADPLRRQVLPLPEEGVILPDDLRDPIGDDSHSPVPGIVHRYPDRALFLLTATCAIHCRFCFRREFIGKPIRTLRADQFAGALAYLGEHPEIWEVILSGGDPLVFPDRYLIDVLTRLRAIPHLRVLRIHSRTPAIFPARLTEEFARQLRRFAPLYLVVHVNHPREVTPEFSERVGYLVDNGVPVLSQSVLLRGVNDRVETLAELFRRLVEARVKPYYLHQLDRAPGTNHFRVPIREGLRLMRGLRGHVSGLCQPTYILDIPGGHGKVPLAAEYVHPTGEGVYEVENFRGERFRYEEPG